MEGFGIHKHKHFILCIRPSRLSKLAYKRIKFGALVSRLCVCVRACVRVCVRVPLCVCVCVGNCQLASLTSRHKYGQ